MSHIAAVNCQIKDLDALEEAVKKFGATLVRDKTRFKAYYGDTNTKCLHVIEVDANKNGYSVGLRTLNPADGFEFACDFFDGSIERTFGKSLVSLQNEYQAVVAERTLQKRGYRLRREVDTRQQIRLVATQ